MRTVAEWLVVPLLVLPALLAVGLALWARDHHRASMARYAERGPDQVEAWLAEPDGAAAWMRAQFLRDFGLRLLEDKQRAFVLVKGTARSARVYRTDAATVGGPWRVAQDYPPGLLTTALADSHTRVAIEAGTPPVEIENPDRAAATFRDLLRAPDRESLARAPLPAAMKLYLLGRWRAEDRPIAWLPAVEAFLRVVKAIAPLLAEDARPLGVGAHRVGPAYLVATGGERPLLVLADRPEPGTPLQYLESGSDDVPVRFVWSLTEPAANPDDLVWSGRVEQPLAGWFTFLSKHGRAWSDAPLVRRLALPVGALLVALFLLPLGLLISLGRRRRLEAARIRFINEIAHDLRTPLTSLRLHAEMLTDGKGKPEQRDHYVRVLNREATRLSSLVGGLLDLSRLESGRLSFDIEPLDMAQVASEAAVEFRALHADRVDDLALDGAADVLVAADRAALARCLANLLDNAGKFTQPGTPIQLRWERDGDRVRVRVRDTGPGIAPEERGRIFRRYERGRRAQKDGIPGTGLGLSLVRELAEGMHGSVRLNPKPPGASFELTLPGANDA